MPQACPFCQSPLAQLNLGELSLSLCPSCHGVFMAAKQVSQLRNELDEQSRSQWLQYLRSHPATASSTAPVLCLAHGQALFSGQLPKVNLSGLVAPCCETLHLTSDQFCEILQRNLAAPSQRLDLRQRKGLLRTLFSWFTDLWDKAPEEDSLNGFAWSAKVRPLYTKEAS